MPTRRRGGAERGGGEGTLNGIECGMRPTMNGGEEILTG